MSDTITLRIDALRKEMKSRSIDAIILPSNDPHQSEYVGDKWKIRAHFSGFTGSAGTLVITQDLAALWTDSRYFLQVKQECDGTPIRLHEQSIPHAPEHIPWLCTTLTETSTIAIDFSLFSVDQISYLNSFSTDKKLHVQDIGDLIDNVWLDRPSGPTQPIIDHPVIYNGEERQSKIETVQSELKQKDGDYYFISSLDEICWLFNIRSKDVDFTPLVTAYALIGKDVSYLFIDTQRVEESLKAEFSKLNIQLRDYALTFQSLNQLTSGKSILANPESLNFACSSSFSGKLQLSPSLVRHLKSIKNSVEIDNAKSAMVKDGIALTRFFIWLEDYLKTNTISEYNLGQKLESFRMRDDLYRGESFAAIVGYKGNGAIIHYTAQKKGSSIIQNEGILLLDSGAQYDHGTTDITRTVWLGGTPLDDVKKAYTLVLKGFIELETAVFPHGTKGIQLDILARTHLWKHGLDYKHGTGHGIGSYGMVHEPAQGFATSMTTTRGESPHFAHQFSTIEPGYYKEGEFGIRTENVVLSKEAFETENGQFLKFESMTLCYIDTQLLNMELLTPQEIEWLNTYHAKVKHELAPHLDSSEQKWLNQKCKSI